MKRSQASGRPTHAASARNDISIRSTPRFRYILPCGFDKQVTVPRRPKGVPVLGGAPCALTVGSSPRNQVTAPIGPKGVPMRGPGIATAEPLHGAQLSTFGAHTLLQRGHIHPLSVINPPCYGSPEFLHIALTCKQNRVFFAWLKHRPAPVRVRGGVLWYWCADLLLSIPPPNR